MEVQGKPLTKIMVESAVRDGRFSLHKVSPKRNFKIRFVIRFGNFFKVKIRFVIRFGRFLKLRFGS